MSRLAKKPIIIPEGTEVKIEENLISIKGPKGELNRSFKNDFVGISKKENEVLLKLASKNNLKIKSLNIYCPSSSSGS